jgi:acetolactate synthase-1/2/3 large subunit
MIPGHEVLAQTAVEQGVRVCFGLMGNSNLTMITSLISHGVDYVPSRHEAGAVSLAMGYAWAGRRPALVTVSHGPGLANTLTALTSAARDRLPVVLVVGDIHTEPPWTAQQAEHRAMVAWTGARWQECSAGGDLGDGLRQAFASATAMRTPVVLSVPIGSMSGEAGSAIAAPGRGPASDDPVLPPDAALTRAVDLLRSAKRPVILGGRGAAWSGCGDVLRELAESTGALLTTTLPANGLFEDDPRFLGVSGGYLTKAGRRLLGRADCVAVFGAGLNGYTTDRGTLFPQADVLHCDADAAAIGRYHPVTVALPGDALATATRLTAMLSAGPPPRNAAADPPPLVGVARDASEYPDLSDDTGVDPRHFLRVLNGVLPADRQVVIDLGQFSTFPTQALHVTAPERFFPTFGFGSLGLALAAGVGASLARSVPTVVVLGDGGALMSLAELETLRRSTTDITVVVLNDAAYGAEVHHLRHRGLPEESATIPPVDFAALSAAIGIPSQVIRRLPEPDQLTELLAQPGPVLLDVRVTRATVSDRFQPAAPQPA